MTLQPTECLSDEQAVAYVARNIGETTRLRADVHMDECAACRWLVSALARDTQRADIAIAAANREARDPLAAGSRIDRYQVIRRIGAGGMGVVYAAHDPELERDVAVKVVRPRGNAAGESQVRLLREAQAMARLSHPGVVPIYDVGTLGNAVFLAMELVDGVDGRRWLAEARPSWRRAVAVLSGAGRGLAAAHAAGLVHRDVKLANILVGHDGRARITDFGLARKTPRPDPAASTDAVDLEATAGDGAPIDRSPGDGDGAARVGGSGVELTRTGGIVGTPAYMAPEHHLGSPVDARSDQFSFCVALYIAVYSEHPFAVQGDGAADSWPALAAAITAGRIRPPPARTRVPSWLRRILVRGLARSPEARWPSLDALLDAIDETPQRRRRPMMAVGAAIAVAALSGAFIAGRSAPASQDDRCSDGPVMLAATWAPAARQIALARIAGLGSHGVSLAPRLRRELDEYAVRWTGAHHDACIVHRSGLQSDQIFARRMACLERGRAALAEVAAILTSASPDQLPETALAAQALPDPGACTGVASPVPEEAPPPSDLAARVAVLAGDATRSEILIAAGRYEAAVRKAHAVVGEARALGYRPLLATALLAEGHATMNLDGGRARAGTLLAEATVIAIEVGDDSLAVEAWARRAWADATAVPPSDAALDGKSLIEGLASRRYTSPFARALLHNNLGTVELAHGNAQAARAAFERALSETRAVTGAGAVELVTVRANLAVVIDDVARRDGLLDEAKDELTRLLGAEHPATLDLLTMHGMTAGTLARAAALLAGACDGYERWGSALARSAGDCWAELGYVADELGDPARAVSAMTSAARIDAERGKGLAAAAGYLALWRGDVRTAREIFAAAAATVARKPDERWWRTLARGELEVGLARSERAAGDLVRARAAAATAVDDLSTVMRARASAPVQRRLTRAQAELAALLAATGGAADEIARLAHAASASLRASGGRSGEIDDLERLAASHRR